MFDFLKTVKKFVNIKKYDDNSLVDPDYVIAYKVCIFSFIIGCIILLMKFIYPIIFVASKIPTILSLILIIFGYLGSVGVEQTLKEKSKKEDDEE